MESEPSILKVLVPIDFSETSRRALAWAFDYAVRAPCELHVIHVVEDSRIDDQFCAMTGAARAELERMVPDADDRRRVGHVIRHLAYGKPSAAILGLAERIGADLIVMGTHGRTGVARLLVGSVAERVIQRADCPVVCVKPGAPPQALAQQRAS